MMSMMGLAESPGTAVLATCWMGPASQGASTEASAAFLASNRAGQRKSYGSMMTGVVRASPGSLQSESAPVNGRVRRLD